MSSAYKRDNREFRISLQQSPYRGMKSGDLRPYGRQDYDFDNTLAENTERPAMPKRSKMAEFVSGLVWWSPVLAVLVIVLHWILRGAK